MSITQRENLLRVYRREEPDYLPLLQDTQTIITVGQGLLFSVKEAKWVGNTDEIDFFGQNWKFDPKTKAYNPDATNYIIKDVSNWRDYITVPDLDAIDWKARFDAENLHLDRVNKVIVARDPIGLWERAFSVVHTEDLLSGLILEPEAMYDFFSTIADHKIKLHNYYFDYYKPDVLAFHDDYGAGQGLFMSPATWRELIKPHLQRVIDNVRSHGVMYEHHCCGYMVPLVDEIAGMGASSWNSVHYCNDPYECKKKFGNKIALVGGMLNTWFIDAPNTTEDQIREHIRDMTSKLLPGYVVLSGLVIEHMERNQICIDELLKSGQQYYKENRPESL